MRAIGAGRELWLENSLIAANEDNAKKPIAKNADKDFFSAKLLFPMTKEQLGRLGFPNGRLRFNDAQNVVVFVKTQLSFYFSNTQAISVRMSDRAMPFA